MLVTFTKTTHVGFFRNCEGNVSIALKERYFVNESIYVGFLELQCSLFNVSLDYANRCSNIDVHTDW